MGLLSSIEHRTELNFSWSTGMSWGHETPGNKDKQRFEFFADSLNLHACVRSIQKGEI